MLKQGSIDKEETVSVRQAQAAGDCEKIEKGNQANYV
jgi:hypothetical protein